MKKNKYQYLLLTFVAITLSLLSSCSNIEPAEVSHSFEVAKDVEYSINDFHRVEFNSNENLDLGFYEGEVWIKLEISNGRQAASYVVLCDDLINRNYRFYKLNAATDKLVPQEKTDLEKYDHRTINYAKPNFQIDLNSNEESTFFITTSSDGRILQASPRLISLNEFQSIKQHSLLFDIAFYGTITIILLINLAYFRMVRNKIYYFYAAYILSGCLMYLFVEGRLYGLGISHDYIDHLMFVSIRIWILSGILFSTHFLETKSTNPRFYKSILGLLFLTLGLTTIYQFAFTGFSISTLHQTENIIGFIWIVLSLTIIGIAYRKRKTESIYYLISYTLFLVFVALGLMDSHTTILPGDPFSYFKIGTILEFIGFTYFMTILVKRKISSVGVLENELHENQQELVITSERLLEKEKLLSSKKGVEKSDLIDIFKSLDSTEDSKLILSLHDNFQVVELNELLFCESDKGYTTFYLSDGKKYLVSKTLKEFEERLLKAKFVRPHQSFMVNLNFIDKYEKTGIINMKNGQKIPVSSRKKEQFLDNFLSWNTK